MEAPDLHLRERLVAGARSGPQSPPAAMEKQDAQPDSLATVAIKSEYPPSEVFGSEPPPAYQKPRSSAVQIARIAGITLVLMSVILGGFILAAAWVQASASCQQFQQQEEPEGQPNFQQLVDPLQPEESSEGDKQTAELPQLQSQQQEPGAPVHLKLPLTLDFDELAGTMVGRNQRSRMNCVVEKRRAEQIVDHQPRTVRLPFGLNLTSDPRYEHVTGEKMAIFCESGKDQHHMPMEMMSPPIVVPLPGPIHLPVQFHGPSQQSQRTMNRNSRPIPIHTTIHVAEARQVPVHIAETRNIPFHIAQARPIPIQMIEGRHIQMAETQHIPIQVSEAHQIPVQMEETHHIPLQMTESRHFPFQMAKAHQIPIQIAEAHQIPVHVAEAHQIPIHMTEARQVPIQTAETHQIPIRMTETREARNFQEARSRGFQHMLPIHVAESSHEGRVFQPMMQQQMPLEQPRPHYVQPRSVRSVEDVLHKRVRRCACDCAC